uniref:Uncharacterized protein n=1 Tax=Cucumis sativus TaxID=3659 RepID=A0A0A0K4V1_CUCSA
MQSKHLCIIEAVASVLFADLENGEPDLLLRRTSLSLYTCNREKIFFFPMQSLSFLFQRYLRMLVLCFPPPDSTLKQTNGDYLPTSNQSKALSAISAIFEILVIWFASLLSTNTY